MLSEFKELFWQVFNENLKIKVCGRETCKQLIQVARQLDGSKQFGNLHTGMLNDFEIMDLARSLEII